MPPNSHDIIAVSDDDTRVDSSPHVEITESEERIQLNQPNVAISYTMTVIQLVKM